MNMLPSFAVVNPTSLLEIMATVFTAYFGFNGPANSVNFYRDILFDLFAGSGLAGYTIVQADGYYDGTHEPSAVVTVICQAAESGSIDKCLRETCLSYKHIADQDSVWLTRREEDLLVL